MMQAHRAPYVAFTGVVAVAGGVAATIGGVDASSVAVGLAFAWAVQAASFWPLAGALEAGRPVAAPWVAGMATRFGGLAALWAVSAVSGRGREAVLAYAFALVTFLLLEAAWLAVVTRGAIPGTEDL
ncbi:MAG: hypothetical protein JJE01_07485 [Gemmatimonadetes bacterium]|nr:hypothetical protein [Gemmatimonadota bacterium]